jgi:hypothetical protein
MDTRLIKIAVLLGAMLLAARPAAAATVQFDIFPIGGQGGDVVVVAPGEPVSYELTALVSSDSPDEQDNNGLAFFSVTVETDLGVGQMPADALDPVIAAAFSIAQGLGTPADDDLIQIGGGQNTFVEGSAAAGIALDHVQLLARGSLQTPQMEGTFTVIVRAPSPPNVLNPGSTTRVTQANVLDTAGFTIRIRAAGDDTQDAGADDQDDQATTGGPDTGDDGPAASDTAAERFGSSLVWGTAAFAVAVGALVLGGPLAGGIALIVAVAVAVLGLLGAPIQ